MDDPDATVVRPPRPAQAPHKPWLDDPDATVIKTLVPSPLLVPRPAQPLPKAQPLALPAGFRLHEYRIDSVLGQGGFGITYLATDVHLNARVAIKEYLPEEIAFRSSDRSVSPNASRHKDRYRIGLDSFLVEARTLASFRHPALVRVARFFEAHQTAYMVLEYERGSPLKSWWPKNAPLHAEGGEKLLVELLAPLFDGLAVVHAAGFLHRDIKPDNIQVRSDDGRLVLLDFGSAGQAVAVADQAAVVVTPGYAPLEQYGMGGQGPWTDIYALGATLYWAVTGRKPPDAELRSAAPSSYVPAIQAGRGQAGYGEAFLKAIDWALEMDATLRPRDVADFRRGLCADHLSSLGLQDALRKGDTVTDGDSDGEAGGQGTWRARWQQRARNGLRRALRPPDWPLALKMTLAMLGTALLPMAATGLYNLRGSQQAVASAEFRFVEQIAQATAGRVAQFINDSRHLARALRSDRDLLALLQQPDAAAQAAVQDKLLRIVEANPDVQRVLLADAAGTTLAASDPAAAGSSLAGERHFQEALQGRSHTDALVVGATAATTGVVFAEPVSADDGRVLGVMALRIRGSSVASIVDEVRNDSSLTPILIDADGVVIHHIQDDLLYSSLAPLPPPLLAQIRADRRFGRDNIASLGEPVLAAAMVGSARTGHVSYHSKTTGQDEVAGFAPVNTLGWVVGVTESRANFEAPLDKLNREMLWSAALVGLLFIGLGLGFARRVVRPIRGLIRAALALKSGDFNNAAVTVESRDELGQLGRTFNVMIDVLRQRERERDRR